MHGRGARNLRCNAALTWASKYLLTYSALSDCLGCPHLTPGWGGSLEMGSDYFTFADKLEATLRGIGRRQVREAEEQAAMINSLLIDSGWHHCLLDKKNESETDSWSDTDDDF